MAGFCYFKLGFNFAFILRKHFNHLSFIGENLYLEDHACVPRSKDLLLQKLGKSLLFLKVFEQLVPLPLILLTST